MAFPYGLTTRRVAMSLMVLVWITFLTLGFGAEPQAAPEITLKGMVLNNVHTGEKDKSVFIYVLDGPPEITAEVNKILTEFYPDKGLDGKAAQALQDQFTAKLKYFITGPHAEEMHKKATYEARQIKAVTGKIEEKDGKKWITVSKYADSTLHYPARMLAPDKPLVKPDKAPLEIKINDTLSLKCLWVPPGQFFMGEPFYQCPHWHEDPPHLVTLTRGFYLSEIPITQEVFEAIVGSNPSKVKGARAPVNVSCVQMYEFCRLLSQKTSRKVRVPTDAEWEYAARVGTSNPTFKEKYRDQDSSATKPMVVKSKPPNAWGFYDMFSSGWERVSDSSSQLDHTEKVDPQYIPPEDKGQADKNRKHGHFGKGNAAFAISEVEYIDSQAGPETTYPGVIRFRVVIEAE